MSSTSAAFGLRPAFHPSGIVRPTAMTIASGYAANILQFQPVLIDGTVVSFKQRVPVILSWVRSWVSSSPTLMAVAA